VSNIDLISNEIDDEGATALADTLKVNTTVTNINLDWNKIGVKGGPALVDALKVNTSVTDIDIEGNVIGSENAFALKEIHARNKRFRRLFLFDARKMLLSLMCTDECGVVWPYLLEGGDKDGCVVPDNIESVRAEFATVVEERRRRAVMSLQFS
jgi:hypothetical protein